MPAPERRPSPASGPSTQHSYGTRIRQHSLIKPSARLRQASDPSPALPRRIKPAPPLPKLKGAAAPNNMPVFPPPGVYLHSDDSTSKVFLAIGRSFLSVDNRAMTIKDLAEMTIKFGLMCQNVSAAGQAITTYIRNHMTRCEEQQDHPLLSRHILSGTPSDDELVPALYSRSGGAHCALDPSGPRATNFRRGTMVWYLSRAAGAPCPFARAGIRLCEYTENGKAGCVSSDPRERKRERDRRRRQEQQLCGQKRKRLARGCKDAQEGSDAEGATTSEAERRPPKVKLTLRLRPSLPASSSSSNLSTPSPAPPHPDFRDLIDLSRDSDSDSDAMSVDSDEGSSVDDEDESEASPAPFFADPPASAFFRMPSPSSFAPSDAHIRRSPSTQSIASPPPDSEDEAEGTAPAAFRRRYSSAQFNATSWADDEEEDDDDDDMDSDRDDDEDEDEDAGPGVQTPLHVEDVLVKREPLDDVGGMLEAWDDMDKRLRVIQVVREAAVADVTPPPVPGIKVEEIDGWDFDDYGAPSPRYESDGFGDFEPKVKEEEEDQLFVPSMIVGSPPEEEDFGDTIVCGSPLTPLPLEYRSPSIETEEMRWGSFSSFSVETAESEGKRRPSELQWQDAEILGLDSILPHELEEGGWTARPREEADPDIALDTDEDGARSSRDLSEAPSVPSASPDSPSADSDDTEDVPGPSTPPPLPAPSFPVSMGWDSPASVPEGSIDPLRLPASVRILEKASAARDEDEVMCTCAPCEPAISATRVSGVEVYQMTLAGVRLLRRIDSDFVNVTALAAVLDADVPALPPTSVDVTQGEDAVCGTWVPLSTANLFVLNRADEGPRGLDAFLGEDLYARFPGTLQELHRENDRHRATGRFGPPFARGRDGIGRRSMPVEEEDTPWERGMRRHEDLEEELASVRELAMCKGGIGQEWEVKVATEAPLSPTEEAMFQTLCRISAWETAGTKEGEQEEGRGTKRSERGRERPLRRSKRVAKATGQTEGAVSRRTTKRGARG